jgi:hypothetical protein
MKNDPLFEDLRERSWRRKLTPREETALRDWLAAHPEQQPDWEAEAGLNEALGRLRDVPMASNFTARVVASALRAQAEDDRRTRSGWSLWQWRLRWLPKTAVAAAILSGGLVSYHQVQVARRLDMANGVARVAEVASAPATEILQDFTAIRAMAQTPPADDELIKLLQ